MSHALDDAARLGPPPRWLDTGMLLLLASGAEAKPRSHSSAAACAPARENRRGRPTSQARRSALRDHRHDARAGRGVPEGRLRERARGEPCSTRAGEGTVRTCRPHVPAGSQGADRRRRGASSGGPARGGEGARGPARSCRSVPRRLRAHAQRAPGRAIHHAPARAQRGSRRSLRRESPDRQRRSGSGP